MPVVTASIAVTDIIDGTDGSSAGTITIYRRAASTPADPADATDFDVTDLSFTVPTGWSKTIPSGTNTLYSASAGFINSTTTLEWSSVLQVEGIDGTNGNNGNNGTNGNNGNNGTNGDSFRTVYVFRNGTSLPSNPTASNFTASTGVAAAANGWATTATVPPAGQIIYVGTVNIRQPNSTGNWVFVSGLASPASSSGTNGNNGTNGNDGNDGNNGINGNNGTDGNNGNNGSNGSDAPRFAEATLYTDPAVSTAPSAPSATITWSTGALSSITSGWSQTPPTVTATSTSAVYSSQLIFIDTVSPFTTTTATGGTPIEGINFSGLVTFTGGDFALDGATITNIDGGNITTGTVTANKIDVDNTINLSGATSSFIAGRTGTSDFGTDGFFIGRTTTDNVNADGFQLSHTSVTDAAHPHLTDGTVQAVIHDDAQGLRIYEPVFYQRGSGAGADVILDGAGETATLAAGDIHTVTVWGGGGGGGAGADSGGTGSNAGNAGGTSTVVLTGATGFNGTRTFNATGGSGAAGASGKNDISSVSAAGGDGQTSSFGAGGRGGDSASGTSEGDAGSAPLTGVFAAGGGGGSGGTHANRMDAGFSADGGGAGSSVTATFDLTNANTDGVLTLNALGAAGTGGNVNTNNSDDNRRGGAGGSGSAGAASVSGILDGYTASTLADLSPPGTLAFTDEVAYNGGGSGNGSSSTGTNGVFFSVSLGARGGNNSTNRGLATVTVNGVGSWMWTSTHGFITNGGTFSAAGGNGNNANTSASAFGYSGPGGNIARTVKISPGDNASVSSREV